MLHEAGEGGLKLGDISEKMLVTGGNVTNLVDRLEDRGYVTRERHTEDRRVWLATLTPEGRAVVETIVPVHQERIDRVLSCLTQPEQKKLAELMDRIAATAAELRGEEA